MIQKRGMCYKSPYISLMVVVLVIGLNFYTEDPYGVRNIVNIFMLPDLYLTEG